MKRALENRFFAWLVRFNPNAPQWRHYGVAGFCFLMGLIFVSGGILTAWSIHDAAGSSVMSLAGGGFVYFGIVFTALGKLVRDNQTKQTEFTKRLAEQEERIRKLEAQVAALTPPSSSP